MSNTESQKTILVNPWSVHTENLLKEVLNNKGATILYRPIQILGNLLYQVAERANELNDPVLTALMCKLTLYEQADPTSPNYIGHDALQEIYRKGGYGPIKG